MLIRNITKITNDSFKRLNEDVNKLLLEDIDAVKKVFMNRFPDMSEEEFDEIIKLDPTYKEGSNSVGKYGKWLLGLYKKDNPLEYDAELIYNVLNVYDNYKNDRKKEIEKDINKIKSINDLHDAVNSAGEAELSARQQEREKRNSKDIKKVFGDNKWEIWVPQSFAGSCTLGKGTNWCTAYSENDSYYKQYTSKGPLYIFISKQNPKEKYQLHVETKSFMDKDDKSADLEDVLSTDNKLKEFVYSNIYGYKVDKDGNFIYDGENKIPEGAISVIVEQGVTSIGKDAFNNCKSLKSITIPNSVTEIGYEAFAGCTSLQSITIPDSVTSINEYAFAYCTSLQSIRLPNSVTSIGMGAFNECTSLKSITIPNSVTSIDKGAFLGCKSLQSITIPDSVTSIGKTAFTRCKSLQSITIPNSVTSIDKYAFLDCKSLQSINIPNSVTKIDEGAFYGCELLQSINIPNSVTSIDKSVFFYCKSLQLINIPDSVTSIDKYAFDGCESLKSINIPNSVTSIGSKVFSNCKSLKSINIPDSVTDIGNDVFENCTSLQSINIPDSVTDIGGGAFVHCKYLQSVNIPNSVTRINTFVFSGCESLQSITIPDSVTEIGFGAFNFCKSLQSITIPDSVTDIDAYAFNACDNLEEVVLENPNTIYVNNAFPKRTKIIKKGVNESMKMRKNKHNKVHHNHDGFIESTIIKESKKPMVIDAHKFSGMRKEDIENALDDMPVGTKLSGIVNAPGTYGAEHYGQRDVVVEKRSAYVANIYNPISSPNDWKYKDIYWAISGYKYHWNIANIILGKDKYYCLSDMATNESINIRKAKRLMEKNGYVVRKNKYLKESDDNTWSNILQSISKTIGNIDNVTMDAQSNINDILHGKHTAIPNIVLSDSETSFLLNIYDKLILLQDEISKIDDNVWKR